MPLSAVKYRIIAVSAAIALGLCSLILTVTITGAILGLPGFGSGPGAFLAACYGLLALGVPAFLFYAALILVDKEWRPDRIFLLAVSLFPFMTLATGVVFVRDYDSRAGQYFFLAWAGRTGFSFTIVVLTVLEVLAIAILKVLLFPRSGSPARSFRLKIPIPALFKKIPGIRFPDSAAGTPVDGEAATGDSAEPAESSAGADRAGTTESPAQDPEGIVLPALKPLASAAAMKKLEARRTEGPEDQDPGAEAAEPGTDPIGAGESSDNPDGDDPDGLVEVVSVKPRPVPKTKIRGSWKVPVEILNHYPDGEYWII
ncbi:MAG: hypothetical protein LBO76_02735, partial [Treponema sp.]|nr:hypothetical protein [Treponema sp.]